MPPIVDLLLAALPLLFVVALAALLIRGAGGPRRHRFRARTEHENGAWARSEWSAGRRDMADGGGGDSGGGD